MRASYVNWMVFFWALAFGATGFGLIGRTTKSDCEIPWKFQSAISGISLFIAPVLTWFGLWMYRRSNVDTDKGDKTWRQSMMDYFADSIKTESLVVLAVVLTIPSLIVLTTKNFTWHPCFSLNVLYTIEAIVGGLALVRIFFYALFKW